MRMMHTQLPEFYVRMEKSAKRFVQGKSLKVRGLENLKSGKLSSLRVGRYEELVEKVSTREEVASLEVVLVPRYPEVPYNIIIKGYDKNGKGKIAVVDTIGIMVPTDEIETFDCEIVIDRRKKNIHDYEE
jgi:hypothetical protein